MKVEKLELADFRNIESLVMEPCGEVNIICADNAQGKTNLLEAIWLFCGAKSFRGAKDGELVRLGAQVASLKLDFYAEGRSQTATMRYGDHKKKASLNEIQLTRPSALTGSFHAVVFSPDHLWVVKHGPEKRRRLLDTGLCQIYPKYQNALEGYERILRQRSFLLRDAKRNSKLLETLEIWDSHAAEYGGYIVSMRMRYLESLSRQAAEVYSGISGGKESLHLQYAPSFVPEEKQQEITDRSMWKKLLLDALSQSREEDIRYGSTTVGPHRDDLIIEVDGLSARSFASQGQQRSCVLALKLAECELLTAAAGESPVILLDDVMSELDEKRREYLLSGFAGRQVFITCCNKSSCAGLAQGKTFSMQKGRITEISAADYR